MIMQWNESTGQPFWEIRAAVKRIADEQLRSIEGLGRFQGSVDDRFAGSASTQPAWLIPIDDDDWIDPALPQELAALEPSESLGIIWENWLLAEDFSARANSLAFCFTNNYAVSTGYLTTGGDWPSVAQHFHAHHTFFRHRPVGLRVIERPDLRSIANKHPCCFTTLERVSQGQRQDFDAAVRLAVSNHCDLLYRLGRGDRLPNEMSWAQPSIVSQLAVFQRCLGKG
ncbi:MAG: hypothetical protein AB7I59_01960 [Geminicoccaceae bacterium]